MDYARRAEKFLSLYQREVNTSLGYKPFHLSDTLGHCGRHPYGYVNGGNPIKPCVFLKLNKIWDWSPSPITGEDFQSENWPEDFKTHFDSVEDKQEIFVDCQGRNAADREAVREGLSYFPSSRGFPASYFPYRQSGAFSLVQIIQILCSHWSRSARYCALIGPDQRDTSSGLRTKKDPLGLFGCSSLVLYCIRIAGFNTWIYCRLPYVIKNQ